MKMHRANSLTAPPLWSVRARLYKKHNTPAFVRLGMSETHLWEPALPLHLRPGSQAHPTTADLAQKGWAMVDISACCCWLAYFLGISDWRAAGASGPAGSYWLFGEYCDWAVGEGLAPMT